MADKNPPGSWASEIRSFSDAQRGLVDANNKIVELLERVGKKPQDDWNDAVPVAFVLLSNFIRATGVAMLTGIEEFAKAASERLAAEREASERAERLQRSNAWWQRAYVVLTGLLTLAAGVALYLQWLQIRH